MSSLRALALLATLFLAPSTARAQTQPEQPDWGVPYVFATVDSYTTGPMALEVTGTLVGESTPRTFRFWAGGYSNEASVSVEAERCDRLALLAMTRPGRFLFTWKWENSATNYVTCTLTRQ
ncbi:hypothetical protein HRD49_13235 [Corallococcus exiguus]|uniref:hypothetical protein n=1 Tax=Corallococcus TaxID=83461 RepID=UPI000EA34941|nr:MULTISPECIES: hypothetical protein [Corallococcus]NNC19030.1 hypothetical protein [Corallococcus exiguus]NRD51550.1 hypothetical protein [Corallococcus exiguus]NRD62710.1 hypothetical protein [Corallococcus exiguus]RKH30807.1 hypothetical protein D7V77_02000 [Corallococcus sp. CA041A]RKI14845.1 hypothetical protein D7Y15_14505 [Corallococcus sp. AB030]